MWKKHGRIFQPTGNRDWRVSHAQLPTVEKVRDDVLRIYYGTRDSSNRTVTSYIEVEADDPLKVTYVHDKPVLGLGELGCFDDSGAMPSWILTYNGLQYLYYIGWNAGVTVPYRNSIGLAVSSDGGHSFARLYKGPIVDRTRSEPYFCGALCVLIENGIWRMWYQDTVRWVLVGGRAEPVYHIKCAESKDGIAWNRRGIVCIDLKATEGGITRPCVIRENGRYKMWYSRRGIRDFRTDKAQSYRIGYAESNDGVGWQRMDDAVGIDV